MQSEPLKILKRLQQFGYKSAIIAGGAVRDDYTGNPITDYDIFLWDPRVSSEFDSIHTTNPRRPQMNFDAVSFEQEQTSWFGALIGADSIEQILKEGGYNGPPLTGDNEPITTTGIGAQLTSIWEAEKDYQTYQLIYTHLEPKVHVDHNFDIGLCKAYCDGEKIRYTPDFLTDIKDRTFTIVGHNLNDQSFAYAIDHHLPKLQKKYPGFTLRVAPHNQHLMADYKKP